MTVPPVALARLWQASLAAQREAIAALAEKVDAIWPDGTDPVTGVRRERSFAYRIEHPHEFGDD